LSVELQVRGFWYFLTPKRNVPFHHHGSVPVLRIKQRKSAADHHGNVPVLRVKQRKSAADHRF